MKKMIAALLAAMMLTALAGCKEAPLPTVEDSEVYARKGSNTLAAAQGEWMVLRAEKNGNAGLLLYNREQKQGHFLVEGAYKNPGLLGNCVYFQEEDTGDLYRYDLAGKEQELLIPAVEQYQVYDGLVYYTVENVLYTHRLDLGIQKEVKTGYEVARFWLTEFGVYYYTAQKQLLMVRPFGSEVDRIVCAPQGEVLDMEPTKGAHIAFIQRGENGGKGNILCTYNPSNRAVLEHFYGKFTALQMVDQKAVVAEGSSLWSIDLTTDQREDWGGAEAQIVQLLTDCAVYYTGNESSIKVYPK